MPKLIVNNYERWNHHAVPELLRHRIGSDGQQKSFQRIPGGQNSSRVSVMVDDVPPLEVGNALEVEAVARRRSIEFERICEPVKVIRLPRHLQTEGGNCKRGLLCRDQQVDDERGAAGAIDRAALHHAAGLPNLQRVARNRGSRSVILRNVNRSARGTNPSGDGQAVVIFIFHVFLPLRLHGPPTRPRFRIRCVRYNMNSPYTTYTAYISNLRVSAPFPLGWYSQVGCLRPRSQRDPQ